MGSCTYYVITNGGGSLQMITVLHSGGSSQMITVLHRGGPANDYGITLVDCPTQLTLYDLDLSVVFHDKYQ